MIGTVTSIATDDAEALLEAKALLASRFNRFTDSIAIVATSGPAERVVAEVSGAGT